MATLLPTAQSTGVEAYEDMFKEITRKLYGEETGHGLHTLGTPIAHVATSGPTLPEGERSFTTLQMSDRTLTSIDYENNASETNNTFKAEDHLTTAFGLAALMQNGFPPPGTILNPHSFQTGNKNVNNSVIVSDERWQQGEECLPWNTNKITAYNSSQKFLKINKREQTSSETSSSNSTNVINTTGQKASQNANNSNNSQTTTGTKRYNCQSCPYSTDRRDLFTRHENIHKDEKPFHCYACLKQFNRADHVKKHFLRMHRELVYDINKTRRNQSNNKTYFSNAQSQQQQPQQPQQQQQQNNVITVPTNTFQTNQQHQQTQNTQNQSTINNTGNGNEITGASDNVINNGTSQPAQQQQQQNTPQKSKSNSEKSPKKKGEKRFVCCYCPWSGADNWGLKRHLNTHTKPFVCMLCDYKAARSERLATHVFKVHNKKACNKCNFLADDQAQFTAHQNEVHPHESRPPRSSANNSSAACNVLRTISNSFIPNTTQLHNVNSTSSSTSVHVFGSTPHNVGNNNGGGYNNTSNSHNVADLANQHLNHWRNSNGGTNSSSTQKRGAERLFQYMEADGSDPEDYNRQLQMAALSRNTASVAQDFHNAGGGDKITSNKIKFMDISLEEFIAQRGAAISPSSQTTSSSSIYDSPPATTNLNNNTKRRRRSSHDKENTNILYQTKKFDDNNKGGQQQSSGGIIGTERLPISSQMKEILSKFYLNYGISLSKSGTELLTEQSYDSSNSYQTNNISPRKVNNVKQYFSFGDSISMTSILKNKDLTVSIQTVTDPKIINTHNEKRNRKQSQPRKIEQSIESSNLTKIRDKHLTRLVSRHKCCQLCAQKQKSFMIPYHSKASLILHTIWRHSHSKFKCQACGERFKQSYKLAIHMRLKHKNKRFSKKVI